MSNVFVDKERDIMVIDNVILEEQSNGGFNFYLKPNCENYLKIINETIYDGEAQRGYDAKGKPKTTPTTVKSVIEGMDEGLDINGTTTINIRKRSHAKQFEYDAQRCRLIINLKENLYLVDGYNRKVGVLKYIDELQKPIPSNFWKIEIVNIPFDEEKVLFAKLNTNRTNASKSKSTYLNRTTRSVFLRDLLEETILGNYVETEVDAIKVKSTHIITFYSLFQTFFGKTTTYTGVFKHVDLKNPIERQKLKLFLIEFIDQLYMLRPELLYTSLEEKNRNRKKYVLIESIFFSSMFYIASLLYGTKNWERELKKILTTKVHDITDINAKKTVDFWSVKNKNYWEDILSQQGHVKKSNTIYRTFVIKSIFRKFFEKEVV